jgi:hypothetical protein
VYEGLEAINGPFCIIPEFSPKTSKTTTYSRQYFNPVPPEYKSSELHSYIQLYYLCIRIFETVRLICNVIPCFKLIEVLY